MRTLPKPEDANGTPFSPRAVFCLCISVVKDLGLKARLGLVADNVAVAAQEYDSAAESGTLHEVERRSDVAGIVSNKEMVKVYTGRMVPTLRPGRAVYDRIMTAAPHGRCPLCDVGVATTLDHHLVKTKYSALTVAPNNLVPACTWCQRAKAEFFPTTPNNQTLHPYFDNFESERWLRADVVEGTPAAFQFSVDPPATWSAVQSKRARTHLRVFKLAPLYTLNAAEELANIRQRLAKLHAQGGPSAVRGHLEEEEQSRSSARLNSWQAAVYAAAVRSDWFCDGGFARS